MPAFKGGQHIAYMAPEGWENQTNTVFLDVYSVGLVFYEILTLRHPLLRHVNDPNNFLDWEKVHLYQQCPDIRTMRNEVPLSISQLLSRMVSKRPGDRPFWDDVLKVLSQPEVGDPAKNPTVTAAVEAAVARKQELQREASLDPQSRRYTQSTGCAPPDSMSRNPRAWVFRREQSSRFWFLVLSHKVFVNQFEFGASHLRWDDPGSDSQL